ncbi:HepT-like ribonuclease domain-containing protein [Williamsia sp. CHRR-6]|uniref:HepT-like ribonuclease domain-containing protein n=1 Tax=Williamsia sp. CHRR-6 TaxID=2835871 RepID=UPI001BDB1A08|nr:HepT-like ribonuclease domain-containing protein [Williamsia sp. CHRR-6]MBT0565859.1 DUF86 domain-containing protein [Williamsia sp. CHRR-6]
MSDNSKARDAVHGVIAVCDRLIELTDVGFEYFRQDTRSQWATEMGLIRIGEGINRVPDGVLARFDGQPWREIVGMRNFAAHQYDDLEPQRVWRTATLDVPALRSYLADTVLPGLH